MARALCLNDGIARLGVPVQVFERVEEGPVTTTTSKSAEGTSTSGPNKAAEARERLNGAVAAAANVLKDANRPDLDDRLKAIDQSLAQTACTVMVVGEFKQGKSSLINSLVNAPVCPVDDDVATAKPTEVHYANEPSAQLALREGPEANIILRDLDFEDLASYVTEPVTAPDAEDVVAVRVGLPRQLLSSGLTLIDTPGIGGLRSVHTAATIAALPSADAVLLVTDASQELTAHELSFLGTIRSICSEVTVVMTKVDFYPAWRKIVDINRGHLQRAVPNKDIPIIPTSSVLRTLAIDENDRELNLESGYGELVGQLRIWAQSTDTAAIGRHQDDLAELLEHLESQLRAELSVLDDPQESDRMMKQLEDAKERADQLRGQAARWQQTLNDGTSDLVADVEYDLRHRVRRLQSEAEEIIDSQDPGRGWDEFETWLGSNATAAVIDNFTMTHHRTIDLAEKVAQHFNADHHDVISRIDLGGTPTTEASDLGPQPEALQRRGLAGNSVAALRGTSGGMIMLSAFSTLAAVNPAAWVLVTVGLTLGRKALKDDRLRLLQQRRLHAKQAVRRYIDDVTFASVKESRDRLRHINRQLRDHFMKRAEELTMSSAESLTATQETLKATRENRDRRRTWLVEHLAAVMKIRTSLEDPR